VHKVVEQSDDEKFETAVTFSGLGVCEEICEAVEKMGY